jgi:hypothetical protein
MALSNRRLLTVGNAVSGTALMVKLIHGTIIVTTGRLHGDRLHCAHGMLALWIFLYLLACLFGAGARLLGRWIVDLCKDLGGPVAVCRRAVILSPL